MKNDFRRHTRDGLSDLRVFLLQVIVNATDVNDSINQI